MRSQDKGYTLAELVAVVAVMGVLTALALPSFMQLKNHMQTRGASHTLTASLVTARLNAVTRGLPVSVCPADAALRCRSDGVWDAGWLVFMDAGRGSQPARAADVLQHVMPAPGSFIRSVQARSQVRFLPDGRSSGSNLTIRVCSGHAKVEGTRVIVSNAGRPRTERLPPDHPDCFGA